MILANLWKRKKPCHVYVVTWCAPRGWLYLGTSDSWRITPHEAAVFTGVDAAAAAAARGEGAYLYLGRYEPWCAVGWLPHELVATIECHRH